MHVVKGKKKKKSMLLRIALVALSVYFLASLVRLRMELNAREKVKAEAENQVQVMQDEIALLNDKNSNAENDIEQEARDKNMAKGEESIFIEVA